MPTTLQQEVQRVIKQVRLALPALLSFAEAVEATQQEVIAQLGEGAVGLIAWAWPRRTILGEQPQQLLVMLNPAWRMPAAGLMEAWNGVVRPHVAVHRSLSAGMLAVLAVWHNHRIAERGLPQGQSPLMRSGMSQQSHAWLAVLGYPFQGTAACVPVSDADPQPMLTVAA